MNNNKRIIGLDVLRSIAIILVMLMHSGSMFLPLAKLPLIGNIVGKLLAIIIPVGYLGVELFFVLSGYLIGSILIKLFSDNIKPTFKVIKQFWIRRWLRTLPNYYFVLLINYVVFVFILNSYPFNWKYLFFIQNFISVQPSFFRESWSLAVEEWSYFLLPIIMFVCFVLFKKSSSKFLISLSICLIFLLSFCVKFAFLFINFHQFIPFDEQLRKVVLFRLDAIMYGFLMAWWMHYFSSFFLKHKIIFLLLGLFFLVILVWYFYINGNFELENQTSNFIIVFINRMFWIPLVGVCFSFMIPFFATLISFNNNILNTVFMFISKISYSLYLIHFPVYALIFFKKLPFLNIQQSLYNIMSYFTVCFVIAYLLYRFWELPFLKWRDNKFKN
jgi:peptidoglycan/LPS O-acetylase OafA/YrhL